MNAVHIDNVKAGMVLADDVRDITSRLLLSRGIRLQPKHIRVFKIWGITEVFIENGGSPAAVAEKPLGDAGSRRAVADAERVFKLQDLNDAAVRELFDASVHYRSCRNTCGRPDPVETAGPEEGPAAKVACDLKAKLNDPAIKLPEIPATIAELNQVIDNPLASASDIAGIVNKSPSLVTVLLKIVNSAIYSFPSPIDSISRAVTLIGSKEIYNLAVGVTVVRMFRDIPRQFVDMPSFLKHSFACGIISRILAARKNFRQTEKSFVAGLLHDIGRLVVYKYFPEEAKTLLLHARASENSLFGAERRILGCRHTYVARILLQKWQLPAQLEDSVYHHHDPSAARDPHQAVIVQMADLITNGMGIGSSGEKFIPALDTDAWHRLALPGGIFNGVLHQALHQLNSLEVILNR